MANRLAKEKSPYLLQHKDNPVDWYPWGEEAFRKASEEEKPVLLSIGYSTCHWCHVMAHESFEDREVADYLNAHFVCIKVDREERPDVDAVYMAVCQSMTGSGGWPLTVFLTPERRPFFAGTYFPKESRYGMLGLMDLLRQAQKLWKTERSRLLKTGEQIAAALNREPTRASAEKIQLPDKKLIKDAYAGLQSRFDRKWGGFGSAPKFPMPHMLLFLIEYADLEEVNGDDALSMAEITLDAMLRGGIYDQIGGGFSRYSTDRFWLVPHFEKMLYDNALLLQSFVRIYQQTGKTDYEEAARQTAEYILRELTDGAGGFYCGQDADSEGAEGKYYIFTPKEICRVLGDADGAEFCRLYNVTVNGNFEGFSIPNRIGVAEAAWPAADPRILKLYAYRQTRVPLHRDDKILLSWSSWAILALAQAGTVLESSRYRGAAERAQQFIETYMTDEQGRLLRRYRDGEAAHSGQLEDYAVYSLALLGLYRATFNAGYLRLAIVRAQQMQTLFEDPQHGGYYMNAQEDHCLIARLKETEDGAIPSGNGVAEMVLELLAGLTGAPKWREAADRQHRFMADIAAGAPSGYCFSLLSMMKVLYPHKELVVVTPDTGVPPELQTYLRTHSAGQWHILIKNKENEGILAECVPFTASFPVEERTLWYLCENGACRRPVSDFRELL